ncbi:MAG: TadE family protein, partial [Acidimicrobiia bacterium]
MNRPGEQGSTVVEFALVSVVAFLILFGMAELAIIVFGNTVGTNAARDGARAGIVNFVDADLPG